MIGVGIFELGIGLILAALILYLAFRGRAASLALDLFVAVLTLIIGIVLAVFLAFTRYALFGG